MSVSARMLQSFAFYYNVFQPIEPFTKMVCCFYFLSRIAIESPRELPGSLATARLSFALTNQSLDSNAVVQRIAGNDPARGIDSLARLPVATLQFFDAAGGRQLRMFLDGAAIAAAREPAAEP